MPPRHAGPRTIRPLRAGLIVMLLAACDSVEGPSTAPPPSPLAPAASPSIPAPPSPAAAPLAVSCQADPRAGGLPLTVRFRSSADGGTGTYDFTWRFGDGGASNQRHPVHTYLRPGVFDASLVVTSGDETSTCARSIAVSGEVAEPTPPGKPGPPLTDLVITITGINGGMSYSPNPASARVGQRVVWRNGDALPHTATANGGAFTTGLVATGTSSGGIGMAAAGTFPYHCDLHPSMVGTLIVTP